MSADLFSNFLGMVLQATGNNNNAWGTILNASALQVVEKALAGNVSHAVTGGTLDLSGTPPPAGTTLALEMLQIFTGTLTSAQIVVVPNLSKFWFIRNDTTGAFPLTVKTTSGTATQIPAGTGKWVYCDGNNGVFRSDKDAVGDFIYSGSATRPGALACNGASLVKTDWPDLYAKIGTTFGSADSTHFTLPLLNDTGRYLRSTTGSLTLGTYQSNQNASHTHTITGVPTVGTLTTDNPGNHTHANVLNDPGHSHPSAVGNFIVSSPNNSVFGPGGNGSFQGATASAATGISITNAAAGAHTHNVTGTLTLGTMANATSGGSETRPESLAANAFIIY